MKKLQILIATLVVASVAPAQDIPAQIAALKARVQTNLSKLQTLRSQIAAEKALDSTLIIDSNKEITAVYNRADLIAALGAALPGSENKLQFVTTSADTMFITEANVEVRNGVNSSTLNGRGNVIVGFNPLRGVGDLRGGSHNLVFGNYVNYSSRFGIVGGYYNSLESPYGVVLTGKQNRVSGPDLFNVVMTGEYNHVNRNAAVVLTGHNNKISSVRALIGTGSFNAIGSGGYESVILTGERNGIWNGIRGLIVTGLRNQVKNTNYGAIGTGVDKLVSSAKTFDRD